MLIRPGSPKCHLARRRAFLLSFEFLLLMPFITAFFLGMIEFSMLISTEARLAQASREGARVGAAGGTAADVDDAVEDVLGTAQFDKADVIKTLPTSVGQPVTVRVELDAKYVIPDFLGALGFSIYNQKLVGVTVMRRE